MAGLNKPQPLLFEDFETQLATDVQPSPTPLPILVASTPRTFPVSSLLHQGRKLPLASYFPLPATAATATATAHCYCCLTSHKGRRVDLKGVGWAGATRACPCVDLQVS